MTKSFEKSIMFAKCGCSKHESLKRYDRRENAVCAP